MKLPPFTLVHKRTSLRDRRSASELAYRTMQLINEAEPELGNSLANVKHKLRSTILTSAFDLTSPQPVAQSLGQAMPKLRSVVSDLNRQSRVTTVGIWDLGTQAGFLPRLIEKLNLAQPVFTFFKVQAAIQAGMASQPTRIKEWAIKNLGRKLSKDEREEIVNNNVISEDFFVRAEQVRRDVGMDYLVGMSPSMVAFTDESSVYWNYFTDWTGRILLVSAYEVNEFSRAAGRTFEMAMAFMAIGSLLVMLSRRLEFHDEDRGCLFDKNEVRANIVAAFKTPHIELGCLGLIAPKYREAAVVMMKVLDTYSREDESPVLPEPGTTHREHLLRQLLGANPEPREHVLRQMLGTELLSEAEIAQASESEPQADSEPLYDSSES